jgi:hypothetical protein
MLTHTAKSDSVGGHFGEVGIPCSTSHDDIAAMSTHQSQRDAEACGMDIEDRRAVDTENTDIDQYGSFLNVIILPRIVARLNSDIERLH